jgi:hypothetical protein
MNKTITASIPKAQLVNVYLSLWNGILKLTDKELLIVEALVSKYLELQLVIKDTKYLYEVLFSTQSLKDIRIKLGLKEQTLNNYKGSLKGKGILLIDNDGNYSLDERVIPVTQITFKFETS